MRLFAPNAEACHIQRSLVLAFCLACLAPSPRAGASLRPPSADRPPPQDEAAVAATCAFDVHAIASESLTGDVNSIRVAVRPTTGANRNAEPATQRVRIAPETPAAFAVVKATESVIEVMVLEPSGVLTGELSGETAYPFFRGSSQRMRAKLTRAPEARSRAGEACIDLHRYRTVGAFYLLAEESCQGAAEIRLRRIEGPHAASRAAMFAVLTLPQNELLVAMGGPLWRENTWIEPGELDASKRVSDSREVYFDRIERMIGKLRGCARQHWEAQGVDVRFRGEYENTARRLQTQLDYARRTQ